MTEAGKEPGGAAGLCILEPGLESYVGHRFNYNRSLVQAAAGAGLRARVLASAAVDPGLPPPRRRARPGCRARWPSS